MKKLNETIGRLKTLMNISEASDVYANVDFKDRVVGSSTPSKDNINVALLKDVQTAAERANVKVDITTAISGHRTGKTRHTTGNAVDIAIINGKAVSNSNRTDAEKLVRELEKMGYVKNRESGNPKAVLTFGFPGHDNHVHISNTTGTSTEKQDSQISEPLSPSKDFANKESGTTTEPETTSAAPEKTYYDSFSSSIGSLFGLNESKIYGNFGKNISTKSDYILIPKRNNDKIKSPVSGKIENCTYKSSCNNQFSIKHEINGEEYYLEFCGIDKITARSGYISQGDTIGELADDVKVYLYNKRCKKEYISNFMNKETSDGKNSKKPIKKEKGYYDPLLASVLSLPKKIFSGDYPSVTGPDRDKSIFSNIFKSPTSKKVNENIERIKKLLK